jgi:hypothetical protein
MKEDILIFKDFIDENLLARCKKNILNCKVLSADNKFFMEDENRKTL